MAEVWRAEQAGIGRSVAVKIILDTVADDPRFVERFLREARILSRLQHPHITPIYDFGEHDGEAFIVTPLLLGGPLAERLRGRMSVESGVACLEDLASALDFAHRAGVIHRDVKPTNVLFDAAGRAYLTDFGLAKACSSRELTTAGAAMGTPLYMSPEQVRGDELDSRTDIYGLGVIAYQILTGQRPFAGDGLAAVLHKTLHVMPDPPSSFRPTLTPGVDAVVFKALAKDRRYRYDTCIRFVQELRQALAGTPPSGVGSVVEEETLSPGTVVSSGQSQIGTLKVTPRGERGGEEALPQAESVSVPHFAAITQRGAGRWKVGLLLLLLLAAGAGGLQSYFFVHSRFPAGPWPNALRELSAGYGASPTLQRDDPWGEVYRYVVSGDGRTYVLASAGADATYQNSDGVLSRLLESRCRTEKEVVWGDDTVRDVVVCNGRFLTLEEVPTGLPR